MRQIWHIARQPINLGLKRLVQHIFVNFVDNGNLAMHLAKEGYEADLGARSLDTIV